VGNFLSKQLAEKYKTQLDINHIKVSPKGASEARNSGLPFAKYELIGFPDDDCWYNENVLKDIYKCFQENEQLDILTCKSTNLEGNLSHTKFKKSPAEITKLNSVMCGIEFTIFCKDKVFKRIGGFDEHIGPGSKFGMWAGEAHDFLLRVVDNKFKSYYTPDIIIYHDVPLSKKMHQSKEGLAKLYSYAKGFGYVLRKNRLPVWYSINYLIRPILGATLAIIKTNYLESRYYFYVFKGRLIGLMTKRVV